MFALPKPLPDRTANNLVGLDFRSDTSTKPYPQHQAITSPLASREKGDWGLKRPLPLKTTLSTTTPLLRVRQVDSLESVTDFASAADHALSLEKFQEMRVAMSVPRPSTATLSRESTKPADLFPKSVFEEDIDFTTTSRDARDDRRWKFQGPWLAKMPEGDFVKYLDKKVRPKRAEFRALLRRKLADDLTTRQNNAAMEKGEAAPARIEPKDVTDTQFTDFLRTLRNDRVTLYALVSKFLDLAPLGQPVGFAHTGIFAWADKKSVSEGTYGKSGPPPSHPSAGISYLRTNSFMENHPVYGPQAKRTPVLSRIVMPRNGASPARLGVGGFVARVPIGDNEFNVRPSRGRATGNKHLAGIQHLDVTTFGGAKAYVEPFTASVDPEGKVQLRVRETSKEAQLVAKEAKGQATIYNDKALDRSHIKQRQQRAAPEMGEARMDRVADEVVGGLAEENELPEKDIMSSSSSYGLGSPEKPQ
jgi:hypothetical protein